MKTRNKISQRAFRLTSFALAALLSLSFNIASLASGGNDLGTSPFDFAEAAYRAHGVVPENIVRRVADASRTGDFVIHKSKHDPNRSNIRAIESTPGTNGTSG